LKTEYFRSKYLKNENLKKLVVIFILSALVFSIGVIGSSYSYGGNITINSGMNNQDIQNTIDTASPGTNIIFTGSNYNNISLIINKSINIISNTETTVKGSSNNVNGESFSSVFYFKQGSEGSSLKGFKIDSKDNGISIINTKNIIISDNTIINGLEKGIYIKGSSNIDIISNILKNNNNGIFIKDSSKITIEKNNIINNNGNGISIYNSNNTVIKNNKIDSNDENGIYLEDIVNTEINKNSIEKNKMTGIELTGTSKKTTISYNNISESSRGILIDSHSIGDIIESNNIVNNNGNIPHKDYGDTGCGIAFGVKYVREYINGDIPLIRNNKITGNLGHSIMAPEGIGNNLLWFNTNWYGSNDPKKSHLCVHMDSNSAQVKLVRTDNEFQLRFYDGNSLMGNLPHLMLNTM